MVKKFSKEEWFNLTKEEQIYHRMIWEKEKHFWNRIAIISSRILSIFLILSIGWIGYIQLIYVNDVNEIKTQYGDDAYCYLCGYETVKQCNCVYLTDAEMEYYKHSETDIRVLMANYNIRTCSQTQDINYSLLNKTLSSNSETFPSFH